MSVAANRIQINSTNMRILNILVVLLALSTLLPTQTNALPAPEDGDYNAPKSAPGGTEKEYALRMKQGAVGDAASMSHPALAPKKV